MKEDIIQMARQAGYSYSEASELDFDRLKRFAALVAAAEREACVRRAEVAMLGADRELTLRLIAAIRARGGHMKITEDLARSAPVQEPVAYRSRMRNRNGQVITGWVVHTDTSENPDPRIEIEPLYATPPAAQPALVQEPVKVGRITDNIKGMVLRQEVMLYTDDYLPIGTAIYTTPPAAQRQWVGLTDESVVSAAARVLSDRVAASCNVDCGDMWMLHGNDSIEDARAMLEAADAKLKAKNG